MFYHLPPTAVPPNTSDFYHGIRALINPTNGRDKFSDALVKSIHNPNCFLVSSGRSALALILLTLKRNSARSKVILPAYTCPTVSQAVLKAGLQPVFCDVDIHTLDMDRQSLYKLLDDQVLAVVPTHLYGLAQDVTDLVNICRGTKTFIIEDAAQAFGAIIKGKMVGTTGDIGFYSLGRGKCIPTGHGGVIIAKDSIAQDLFKTIKGTNCTETNRDLVSLVKFLAYGLATTPFGWWFIDRSPLNPANAGMDLASLPPINFDTFSASQAGIGISILMRINQINAIRRRNAQRLQEILTDLPFVTIPKPALESEPVFLRFPIILDEKARADNIYHLLSRAGIGVSRSYTRTLPDIFSAQDGYTSNSYLGANHLADSLLTLPTHPYLDAGDLTRIQNIFLTLGTK